MESRSALDQELFDFVRSAKDHGIADEFAVALLRQNGWSERRVFRAYSSLYADVLGRPLPTRGPHIEHARDAFYYLLNFLSLGFWTVALGQIWYTLIAHRFPDATQRAFYGGSLRDQISWQVATVIIAFPLFLFVHNLIRRELGRRPDLYDSGVRKWLTYIALFIAATIVITDGIWFINALLRGEITVRFILDSLVLLILGGGVFAYYSTTLERSAS